MLLTKSLSGRCIRAIYYFSVSLHFTVELPPDSTMATMGNQTSRIYDYRNGNSKKEWAIRMDLTKKLVLVIKAGDACRIFISNCEWVHTRSAPNCGTRGLAPSNQDNVPAASN
jgi:hypothetical protein